MQILCKGFNHYNQLNQAESSRWNYVEEFTLSFEGAHIKQVQIGYTLSLLIMNNENQIHCFGIMNSPVWTLPDKQQIHQIALSESYLLVLGTSGQLFKIFLADGQRLAVPHFIDSDDKIKLISANFKLNVAYTFKGYVYSIPEKVDFNSKDLVDIQTGKEHCLLLDRHGRVYAFGAGSKGQLGNGQLDDHQKPVLVEALAGIKIVKIAAGGWHSAAVSEHGDIYTWGWNANGQLGLAKDASGDNVVSVMATPQVVDIPGSNSEVNVIDVACGSKHTILLLENGFLYGCGWNKYKQLIKSDVEDYWLFTRIPDLPKQHVIDRILCGPWHSAVILK